MKNKIKSLFKTNLAINDKEIIEQQEVDRNPKHQFNSAKILNMRKHLPGYSALNSMAVNFEFELRA